MDMKIIVSTVVLIVSLQLASSGQRHLEFVCKNSTFGYGLVLDFYDGHTDGLAVDTFTWEGANAGACPTAYTEDGRVVAWYNGRAIYDGIGSIAINGDDMERGACWQYFTGPDWGLAEDEGVNIQNTAVMVPGKDSLYFLFHHTIEFFPHDSTELERYVEDGSFVAYSNGLYMTTLQLRPDGRVEVLADKKAVKIIDDYLASSSLAACKNADNSGWYIVSARTEDEGGYLLEVDMQGNVDIRPQALTDKHATDVGSMRTVFNSDGTMMARLLYSWNEGQQEYIELYSFDRCDGTWQLLETIGGFVFDRFLVEPFSDIEFSPDGRYLYWALTRDLIQFDVTVPMGEVHTTADTVAIYEEVEDSPPPFFTDLMTLPNGKIVLGSTVATGFLHLIHEPNRRGIACDVQQSAYLMPMYPDGSRRMKVVFLPSPAPIYMEPADLVCDTATDAVHVGTASAYPNPTTGAVYLPQLTRQQPCYDVKVYSTAGGTVLQMLVCDGEVDLSSLPLGLYLIKADGYPKPFKVVKY